ELISLIAEVDERRLYLTAGYPSMLAYCIGRLHFSEHAARKRVHAARAARQFPALFDAVAEGRLHLTAVITLAPYLSPRTVDDLIAAATHKTRAEVERLLAERYPRTEALAMVEAIPAAGPRPTEAMAAAPEEQRAPERVEAPPSRMIPVAAGRFDVHF